MHPRRQARESVLQALYAYEVSEEPQSKVLADIFGRYKFDKETKEYVSDLFNKVINYKQWSDEIITNHLENWDYDRVARLDRLILRLAICELYYVDDVPPKVSIAEAIEIAKQYSTEESSGFVNGILDAIYREMLGKTK